MKNTVTTSIGSEILFVRVLRQDNKIIMFYFVQVLPLRSFRNTATVLRNTPCCLSPFNSSSFSSLHNFISLRCLLFVFFFYTFSQYFADFDRFATSMCADFTSYLFHRVSTTATKKQPNT